MVLESNRDLVLRRLTEALGRDRTRHQVSEVTSLGLVQLTRKRLGTGLIEAFSTSCQHCAGRGIVLHADPVDSAASGRKTESAGGSTSSRRSKRSKKPKVDESAVAKVPVHTPGDHPMFKAMAAASDRHEDDEDDEDETAPDADELLVNLTEQVDEGTEEVAQDDLESDVVDEDVDDDADDDEEDADEVDLDDDDDEDFDDDLDVIDESDESDEDEDADDAEDSEDFDEPEVPLAVVERPRRRRAAARPAGPPI